VFERWINEAHNKQELIDRLDYAFEIGGHKAGILAKLTQKPMFISCLSFKKKLWSAHFCSALEIWTDALRTTTEKYGPDARITVMPLERSLSRASIKNGRGVTEKSGRTGFTAMWVTNCYQRFRRPLDIRKKVQRR